MSRSPLLLLVLLLGCTPSLSNDPPVGADDDDATGDDDDATASGDWEDVWESLDSQACDVVPDSDMLLPYGDGRATTGLWYELACVWIGGNASQITFQFDWFDERNGGVFPLISIDVRDLGGSFVSVDGEFGALELLPSDDGTLNGWWAGDLSGVDAAGIPVQLDAVVFRDAFVDTVVGR